MRWVRSTHSNSSSNCVEVAEGPDDVRVRDSKDPDGPVLIFTRPEWGEFIQGLRTAGAEGEMRPRLLSALAVAAAYVAAAPVPLVF